MRRLIILSLLTALTVSTMMMSGSAVMADNPKYLKVGTAIVDSSPTVFPAVINGGFLPSYKSEINDPLHIRAFVIDDGTTCLAMAICDVCILPSEVADEAKKRIAQQIPLTTDRIMTTSTHCHSAPSLISLLGCPADENYVPLFIDKVVEAVVKAYNNRQDARIGWSSDEDRENVFCRRFIMKPGKAWTQNRDFTGSKGDIAQMNPGFQNMENAVKRTGEADPTVSVVAFQSPDGKPLALIANYSTHYAGAPKISADYFAVFADEIGKALGADDSFLAAMTNGTSGDTNCIDFYNPKRKFDMYTVGKSTAAAAKRACDKMTFVDWVPVKMEQRLMNIGIRKGTPEQVKLAKDYLAKLEAAGKKVTTIDDAYALSTVTLDQWPDQKQIVLQAIRLGQVGIAALPNETYSFTGRTIRKDSPAGMTFTCSMANGYGGYLPTADQFELGGYTTWRTMSSCFEINAESKIRAELLDMLGTLFK